MKNKFNLKHIALILDVNKRWSKKQKVSLFKGYKKVFDNIEQAISEFDVVISLSARRRDINKKHITLVDLNNILKKRKNSNFGFMFGPENSGLSNKDISLSNFVLQIPT